MPKRKEQEALSRDDVNNFRGEIVVKEGLLATAIAPDYPVAERVSKAIHDVLNAVKEFGLEGKWVTSRSGVEYVTNQEIRSVSIFPYLFQM
jgi:hypothetical protein